MKWNRSTFDRGKKPIETGRKPGSLGRVDVIGTRIPRTPLTYAPPRQPPPPFPAVEGINPGTAGPPVPPSSHPPSSRLIMFPNVDILGGLTSDQLNVLIFQYLEEEGLAHTACNLAQEARIKHVTSIDKSAIPKRALFSFVQDGLRYTQLKANLHASDSGPLIECCRVDAMDIITKSVHSLSQIIKHRKEIAKKRTIDHEKGVDYGVSDQERESKRQNKGKDKEQSNEMRTQQGSLDLKDQPKVDIHKGFFLRLESYRFTSGSWGEGELLATGSIDGRASIWNKNGELQKTLDEHRDSISSIEWNRKGDFLLTGSYDSTVIIWDTRTWKSKQELTFDSELMPCVEWRNNTSFTTCSTDKRIFVWNIGDSQPIITFTGHQDDIDGIKWDPTGTLLASNSNDGAIKIWTLKQDQSLHDLMHREGINSIRWSPTGPGTSNPNKQLLLASASDDATVKIWDGAQGRLLYTFTGHWGRVIEIEFSPDGDYIASGSEEQRLLIWKVKDLYGTIVKSCIGCDPLFYNISWNREGNKIAAGYKNGTLCVIRLW